VIEGGGGVNSGKGAAGFLKDGGGGISKKVYCYYYFRNC
jgi:hypothetical protein